MAELFPILIIIFVLVSITSKGKNAKKNGTQQRTTAAQPQQARTTTQPVRPAVPVRPAAMREQTINTPKGGEMKPRVATTVEVSKHDHSGMFEGSMQADTHEGQDPCHDGELGEVRMPSTYSDRIINRSLEEEDSEPQLAEPAIDLEWDDSKSLVKAFVMQEVLTRPCDRRR